MTANPNIVAPNTTIEDDSINHIASRIVARVRAKGLGIQGVYVDDWTVAQRVDVLRVRGWSIDVVADGSTDPDAQDVVGSIEITEKEVVHMTKYRGIGVPVRSTAMHFAIGYSTGAVIDLLGVRQDG